jgi:hypothetical protein
MKSFIKELAWLFLKQYNYLVYSEVSTNDSIHITVKKSWGQILEHFGINFCNISSQGQWCVVAPFEIILIKQIKVLTQNIGHPEILYEKQYNIIVNISEFRHVMCYDIIYLLTASGLPPGGSCTVHIYT